MKVLSDFRFLLCLTPFFSWRTLWNLSFLCLNTCICWGFGVHSGPALLWGWKADGQPQADSVQLSLTKPLVQTHLSLLAFPLPTPPHLLSISKVSDIVRSRERNRHHALSLPSGSLLSGGSLRWEKEPVRGAGLSPPQIPHLQSNQMTLSFQVPRSLQRSVFPPEIIF